MNTFRITSSHDVWEDSFSEGEMNHVNSWTQEAIIKSDTLLDAIKQYYAKQLFMDFNMDRVCIDMDTIDDSRLINEDNQVPSEHERDEWEASKKLLYSENICIRVQKLEDVNLEEELF